MIAGPHRRLSGGRGLLRELYLPEKWTSDVDRCREAGIGDGTGFATKPELARRMAGLSLNLDLHSKNGEKSPDRGAHVA